MLIHMCIFLSLSLYVYIYIYIYNVCVALRCVSRFTWVSVLRAARTQDRRTRGRG